MVVAVLLVVTRAFEEKSPIRVSSINA